MILKEAIKKLEESKVKLSDDYFLSYCLMINDKEWIIGFYSKEKDDIISFITTEKEIKMEKSNKIFKKPETKIRKLNIDKIKIWDNDVIKIINKEKEEKYPKEVIVKKILLLQNIDEGQLWNISLFCKDLSTINFKINAETGKLISHDKFKLIG